MANILKRPMFRRGGSAAYDVGITSGLEPRKKYQVGGMSLEGYPYNVDVEEDEDVSLDNTEMNMSDNTGITSIVGPDNMKSTSNQTMETYADAVQKRLQPTDKEKVLDYLTAFGATGGGSPTSLRTWGSSLGKAAANYQNIVAPKEQAAKKSRSRCLCFFIKRFFNKRKIISVSTTSTRFSKSKKHSL
jgi:hypothetical protein